MKGEKENWEDYLYRKQTQITFVQLYGFEPFEELFRKGIITPYITAIRLMYTGIIDIIYMVNQNGRLVNIKENDVFDLNCESFDPMEILSKRVGDKMWWEVEGIKPKGYDERR